MRMRNRIFVVILGCVISACGVLWNVKVECRKFNDSSLKFFPGKLNDSISFVNDAGDTLHFILRDKRIFHTTQYTSDTGCGCEDEVKALYVHQNDSIWIDYSET